MPLLVLAEWQDALLRRRVEQVDDFLIVHLNVGEGDAVQLGIARLINTLEEVPHHRVDQSRSVGRSERVGFTAAGLAVRHQGAVISTQDRRHQRAAELLKYASIIDA